MLYTRFLRNIGIEFKGGGVTKQFLYRKLRSQSTYSVNNTGLQALNERLFSFSKLEQQWMYFNKMFNKFALFSVKRDDDRTW